MHILAIHPQNHLSDNSEDNDPIDHETRPAACSPTKRFVRFLVFIILVGIGVICAIVIPLVLHSAKQKDTTTTESTDLENTTYHSVQSTSTSRKHTSNTTTTKLSTTTPMINPTDLVQSATTMDISSTSNDHLVNITMLTKITEKKSTMTSTESQTTEQTTTSRPLIPLNYANDTIISIYNTTAGKIIGGFNGTYNDSSNGPHSAIDNNLGTTYLNMAQRGVNTGFVVVPSISNSTVACRIQFAGARYHQRNPLTVTLEGSNVATIDALIIHSNWTLLYNGSTGIPPNATGFKFYDAQIFKNTKSFRSYRLLITSTGGSSLGAEYSEARIIGYI